MTTMTLALTGVTGHLGRLVATRLADMSPVLVARDPARVAAAPGQVVRQATYADAAACRAAFRGVTTLLLVSAAESRTRREEHRSVIGAAADAGVEHIVYTSFAGAAPDATFTLGRDHYDAELAIQESGMAYTLLRDNFYADVLPTFADASGAIRGPAGDGRVAAVGRADVAHAAALVLRTPREHSRMTYTLTGPEALTLAEVAARAGAALGRHLFFVDETEESAYAWRRAEYGAEQWQLDAWVSTYTAIRDGSVATVTRDVERVTRHPARTLEEVLRGE